MHAPSSLTVRVLALTWLGLAVVLAAWGLVGHPGRVRPAAGDTVELFAGWRGGALLSVRVEWRAPPGGEAWVVLEPAIPWGASAESFWRRRVGPGTNDLLWPVAYFPTGQPVRLRATGSPPLAWSVSDPLVAQGYGVRHLAPLRGLLLTLALLVVAAGVRFLPLLRRVRLRRPSAASLALAGVAALALALRLHTLTIQSLWFDEVLTAIGAQSLAWVLYTPRIFGHPPLQYLLAWVVGVQPGDETWLRAPFVAAGVAGVVATGRLGTVLLGPRVGLLAALGLAVSAVHVEASQTARPYAPLLLLTVLSLLALLDALRTDRPTSWLLWSATMALALYTQYLAAQVLVLESLTLAGVLGYRRTRRLAAPLWSLAGIGLLWTPWLATMTRVAGAQIGGGNVPGRQVLDLVTRVITPLFLGQGYATPVALGLLGLALVSLRRRMGLVVTALLWIFLPALVLWLAQPRHFVSARHLAFVLPVLMLGVAQGIVALADGVHRAVTTRWPLADGAREAVTRRWPLAAKHLAVVTVVIVVLAWVVPGAAGLRAYYVWRHGFDWRDVAQVLDRTIPRDAVVFATAGAAYPLRHYWDQRVEVLDPLGFPEQLRARPVGRPVWVVSHDGWDRPPEIAAWLDDHAVKVGWVPWSWSLPGVSIYRLP